VNAAIAIQVEPLDAKKPLLLCREEMGFRHGDTRRMRQSDVGSNKPQPIRPGMTQA
jgi:hypothetical protein